MTMLWPIISLMKIVLLLACIGVVIIGIIALAVIFYMFYSELKIYAIKK